MTTSTLPRSLPPASTLADLVPAGHSMPLLRDAVLVVAAAALTAGAAQVSFTVPWTPVPYTLQTGAVLLSAAALGSWRGLAAMLLYLAAGAAGLHVFSDGAAGLEQILGRTGGYLLGFVAAAWVVGRLAERRWDRSIVRSALLMVLGTAIIYALGVPVLSIVGGISLTDALWFGAAVFVPWDLAKVALAAVLLPMAWRAASD
jgi:biotin transport system substrate-specific component